MAEIEYEVRERDLLAFNEQQMKNSARLQKTMRRHQGTIPGMMVLIALFIWFYYQDTLSAIYVALSGAAWGVLTPLYFRWNIRRQVRRMYTDEEKACVLGTYKLRTETDALIEVSREGESRVPWRDILRIEATKQYAFIFVGIDTALIVPRATVKSGNLHEFVKEVDGLIERAA